MGTDISVLNRLRPFSIGFDSLFDHFESLLEYNESYHAYPPYNLVQVDEENFVIEIAVAGFNKEDLNMTVENGILIISTKQTEDNRNVLHRGISHRHFKKQFRLADNVEVKSADLSDGLLTINLERIIPEYEKLRTIEIS
jgi:molecular chaperone IbpA